MRLSVRDFQTWCNNRRELTINAPGRALGTKDLLTQSHSDSNMCCKPTPSRRQDRVANYTKVGSVKNRMLLTLSWAAITTITLGASVAGQGIQPYPNANTDRFIHQKTPMPLPPVGVVFADPDFGSKMVRVPDAKTNFLNPGTYLRPEGSGQASEFGGLRTIVPCISLRFFRHSRWEASPGMAASTCSGLIGTRS